VPTPSNHFPLPLIGELKDTWTDPISGEEKKGMFIELEAPFCFADYDAEGNVVRSIVVPVGFTCNFNSVPRGFWNFFPPTKWPEAGVVHDYLYRYNGLTRKEADEIHRRILELKGAPKYLRTLSHTFLRLFAGGAWEKYRKMQEQHNDGSGTTSINP
jgi:hypothetical protein